MALTSAAAMAELPREESTSYARALAANMTLNAGWSALFFRGHQPWLAALDGAALTASGLDLARRARPTGGGKSTGLAAYAAWSAFAAALTGAIALRNRTHPRRG